MKHYDDVEWILYKEKALSNEKSKEMEEHLYECDECMDIFLSLIDSEEIDKAEEIISTDFTDNVMNRIQKEKYRSKTRVEKYSTKFKNIFGYYVAVAAVTIILTWGGFYSGMVDILPQVAKSTIIDNSSNRTNIVFNVSERIVNKTSTFINVFETINTKEGKDEREK